MSKNKFDLKFYLIGRVRSIGYALKGISLMFRKEPNAWLHLLAIAVVTLLGIVFDISRTEWCLQILAIGGVVSAELFNTAIERFVDFVHPDYHKAAGGIKDLAAGAVFFFAICAFIIGGCIYIPKGIKAFKNQFITEESTLKTQRHFERKIPSSTKTKLISFAEKRNSPTFVLAS